jgi:hypothetical protein
MQSRFDTEARIAVAQATDIARELGHSEVGPDHLLLGLLANVRGPAYAALTDHGLRLDAARELVVDQHSDADPDVDPTDKPDEPGLDDDRDALRAIGIDLDRVREAVRDNLGADLTQGWGSRPERARGGRSRGRGRGERHERHGHHHGRGRRGPHSRRDDGPRFSAALRHLLREVRRASMRDRLDRDSEVRNRAAGMTGPRLALALLESDDTVVRAVLATATDLEGLRGRLETAVTATRTA